MNQKGAIALVAPILLLVIIGAVVFLLYSQGIIKLPVNSLLRLSTKEPTVKLQTDYKNPFDKNTQYVNPFSSYQNPFDNLK